MKEAAGLRSSSNPHTLAAAAIAIGALAAISMAQGRQAGVVADLRGEQRVYPAPVNLKVLPKGSTGQQVAKIMKEWEGSLGVHCGSCHAEDREKTDQDGKPLLDFASDAKPMKTATRLMVAMTAWINQEHLAKMDNSGVPVTCGTCHRGHLEPEEFKPVTKGPAALVNSPQAPERDESRPQP